MSSKAFVIPTDDLTFMDKQRYRIGALAAGIQRCYNMGIATWDKGDTPLPADPAIPTMPEYSALFDWISRGNWPKNLDAREFQPNLDAGAGAALDWFFTANLVAVGAEYSCLGAVAVAPAAARIKKIVVWYKVLLNTNPPHVNRLLFRRNAAAGLLQAEFDLQQLFNQIRVEGFFSEPVIWDNNTAYAVNALCHIITNAPENVVITNFLFEPAGTTNV